MTTQVILEKKPLNKKAGIAMNMDFLLFLGALFLLIFFVVSFNKTVKSKLFGSSAATEAMQLTENTQDLYRGKNVFTGLTSSVLINNNAVPKDMVAGSNILNQWNDLVNVSTATRFTSNDLAVFQYKNVSTDDCSKFVKGSEADFLKIVVGSTNVKDMTANPPKPLDPASLGTSCHAGGKPTVDVTYTFGRG